MSWADGYYRSRLTAQEQQIYDAILGGWSRCETEIPLPAGLPPGCDTNPVVECVVRDHPEIFWIDYYAYSLRRVRLAFIGLKTSLHFRSFHSPVQTGELQQQVLAWRSRILAQVDRRLPLSGQMWLLYDYLARQVTYGEHGNAQSHTLLGCMLPGRRVAVCEGIAKGFKFLCDGAGIPCIIVSGTAPGKPGRPPERHAWNLVQVDGAFRHLDVTAELTQAKRSGMASRTDYLFTDGEMRQQGYGWDAALTPQCC